MNKYILIVITLILISCSSTDYSTKPISIAENGAKQIMTAFLNNDWKLDNYVSIPNIFDTAGLDSRVQQVAKQLNPAMKSISVSGVYEISYSRTKPPLDNVSVRILEFTSVETANSFVDKKIESREGEFTNNVDDRGIITYTGTKLGKVIMLYQNMYVAVFRLNDPSTNKLIASKFLERIIDYSLKSGIPK
jgi:hypothetical protein